MDIDLEFDGCLQSGSGIAEALAAAGIECRKPASGEEAGAIEAGWNEGLGKA